MVKNKPYGSPEGVESKGSSEENKGRAYKPKNHRKNNTGRKNQGQEIEADTNFKCRCSDIEGYVFDLGSRALYNFYSTMKELKQYLGGTYIDSCQTVIMTETPETFLDQ